MSSSILFSPHKINKLLVKNRFVCSATHLENHYYRGLPSEKLYEFYTSLAKGNVGLIITGNTVVDGYGDCAEDKKFPYCALDDDCYIEPWKKIVDEVHRLGSKIAVQLAHLGIQEEASLRHPIGPSRITIRKDGLIPDEMTIPQIKTLIDKFVDAGLRAKKIGFDAIQLHSAHGYLISNFISPYTNRRKDEYGGSTENRARFLTEIVKKLRRLVGEDFSIMAKLNFYDVEGGLDLTESLNVANVYARAGIDCIEVSGGVLANGTQVAVRKVITEDDEAYFLQEAKALKQAVPIPVILVGGLRSFHIIEDILKNKESDLVAMSRPFICEQELIARWEKGDLKKSECISCNGCLSTLKKGEVHCLARDSGLI